MASCEHHQHSLLLLLLELLDGLEEVLDTVLTLRDEGAELLILLLQLVALSADGVGLGLVLADELLELLELGDDGLVVGAAGSGGGRGGGGLLEEGLGLGGALLEGDDLSLKGHGGDF